MDISSLPSFLLSNLSIASWRDILEILFFSSAFYLIVQWLKKDREKNLVGYFYAYCLLTLASYSLTLPSITYCLFLFSPAIILLFMFAHQETLQRNLVTLKNITVAKPLPQDWLNLLLRSCLKSINNNKPLLIMLEYTDSVQQYIKTQYICDAQLTEGFFSLLMDNNVYDPKQMLWINHYGAIRGVNSSWKASWQTDLYSDTNAWKDDAIAYTAKCDALIIYIDTKTHTCSLALQGTLHELLTIEQAGTIIKKHIHYQIPSTKKGTDHAIINQKNNPLEQRAP